MSIQAVSYRESVPNVLKYEPASWHTGQAACMPGAIALAQAIQEAFPHLVVNRGIYGCFNDRAIAGSDVPSLHREGRALDIGVPEAERGDGGEGWAAACALVGSGIRLGVQLVLWDRHTARLYGPEPWQWRRMQANTQPHTDHLHCELRWKSARNLSRSFAALVLDEWLTAHPAP